MADKKKIEDLLGEKDAPEEEGKNPLEATPSGEGEEENPLKKMDEISKAKPGKKEPDSKTLDDDVVTEMFKTGENTEGMFIPKKEEEHEEEDEKAKVKIGKDVKPSEKYEKQFKNDMVNHPDQYKIMTPKGEMTVAEAMKAGYNPITKRFEKGHGQDAIKEKHLAGLNDADRSALEQFTNPANAQVAPADAEKYGLQPGSPMIRPEQGVNPSPEMNPMMAGLGAQPGMAAPQAGPAPLGTAMPGAEESMAPGGMDINALLGGGQ